MQRLNLKPTRKLVRSYYDVLGQFGQLSIDHEGAVRIAFRELLAACGRRFDLTLVDEYPFQPPKLHAIRIDGALLNPFRLASGYWEAKDEHDDLEKEIRAKLERGYPRSNIIFQAPERAVLFQHSVRQGLNEDIRDPKNLVELLKQFLRLPRAPHQGVGRSRRRIQRPHPAACRVGEGKDRAAAPQPRTYGPLTFLLTRKPALVDYLTQLSL
jgi:hypothetical protein